MKNTASLFSIFILTSSISVRAAESELSSNIVSVKLYQNQAKITRSVRLMCREGLNTVVIGDLPPLLYDWSVKGSMSKDFSGKIVSIEVEEKAMVQKRQTNILQIEEKLKSLREKDRVFVDELENIKSQEKFLNSIMDFTNQNVSKELATRIPQVSVWNETMQYVTQKRKDILSQRRDIEKSREELGKEIQKWEFELSQIAGNDYFRNYQSLNKAVLTNRANLEVQQFADITGSYAEKKRLLKTPTDKVDIVKRLIASIHSPNAGEIDFTFSYVIPNTMWQMKYDLRADNTKQQINMVVYGDIYQKTGENWKDISLSLSTGMPVSAISPPVLSPWYLDIYERAEPSGAADDGFSLYSRADKKTAPAPYKKSKEKDAEEYQPSISEKGPYFEITMPMKQSLDSSTKYQKKYIKDFSLEGGRSARFFYEITPSQSKDAYLKTEVTNSTALPWLPGEAQIFLDNEFMGKASMPFTPVGKKETLVLGIESRVTAKKELVKKYEDTAGAFGGKRRIVYSYKITIENQLPVDKEIIIVDSIPISRNKKIDVEIKNQSHQFIEDKEEKESAGYAQGIRKWKINAHSRKKIDITYEVSVVFDKDTSVSGLR